MTLVMYDRRGRIKHKLTYENRQRVGEYVKNYKQYFFINGLEVRKDFYEAKPEDIDPKKVLSETNAQVRAMFLKKIGLERVVKECQGAVIDRDTATGNELYEFPVSYSQEGKYNGAGVHNWVDEDDRAIRILKVICPSTKNEYFLRIPVDEHFNTCEKARQGTFNGFEIGAEPVEFALET